MPDFSIQFGQSVYSVDIIIGSLLYGDKPAYQSARIVTGFT